MRNKRRTIWIGVAFAAAAALLLVWLAWPLPQREADEPVYHGRPLSAWLEGFFGGTNQAEALNALDEAGTNAIPTLLRMLRAHDSPLKARFFALVAKQHLMRIPHVDSDTQNMSAYVGFRILGSRGAPAVPELLRIYDRESSPVLEGYIAAAFVAIGPDAKAAVPSLLRETGNTNRDVRGSAYVALGSIRANPETVVPVIIKGLQDPSFYIRARAAQGLGIFGPDAKSAVPALVDCIQKINLTTPLLLPGGEAQASATQVRNEAIGALKRIDPEAAAKLAAELNETW